MATLTYSPSTSYPAFVLILNAREPMSLHHSVAEATTYLLSHVQSTAGVTPTLKLDPSIELGRQAARAFERALRTAANTLIKS